MTKKEILKALVENDIEAIKALALAFTKAQYNEDDDELLNLAEDIKEAITEDTREDITLDLRDADFPEAVEFMKANY